MAEYIKREDAKNALCDGCISVGYCYYEGTACASARKLDRIPAADVRQNVRGKWYWDNDGYDWNIGAYRCSNCKSRPGTWWAGDRNKNPLNCSGGSFCGNCGADMRGAEDE